MDWTYIFFTVLKAVIMVTIFMSIAGYTVVAERKVASWIQERPGPNRTTLPIILAIPVIGRIVTRLGLIQLPADGGKFLFKEDPFPGHVNKVYFILAPIVALIPALTTMTVLPFGEITRDGVTVPLVLANLDVGMLFILAFSSLGVYGIILAGWASNSKYPFLGGIRASAQVISYELAMGMSLLPVFMWAGGTLNLFDLVEAQSGLLFGCLPKWMIFFQPVSALLFLTALFAETNRLPFDMPESETDLVAGFNTEYGAFKFGLFFVGEYAHVTMGSALFVVLFLGGWSLWPLNIFGLVDYPAGILGAVLSALVFMLKTFCLIFFFLWIRWTLPRFRYDQIMNLGWKRLLPIAIANFVVYAIAMAVYIRFFNQA
ncbi:MAG: NADH-quinone oxidoreductase subunit H [Opitutales bacterium]|nr:NADH-quinone oxidoreductase subunit H [Opitutales bacterium]